MSSQEPPFSRQEAKRVAAALFMHPIAFAVWVGGIFAVGTGRGSMLVYVAMGIAFVIFLIVTVVSMGASVRIAGRSAHSLTGTMFHSRVAVPWSLLLGRAGREVYELADWSLGLLWIQRIMFILVLAGVIAWMWSIVSLVRPWS